MVLSSLSSVALSPPQPNTTGFNYHAEEIMGRSGGRGQVADVEKVMGERRLETRPAGGKELGFASRACRVLNGLTE
jgi:hypothetical protein